MDSLFNTICSGDLCAGLGTGLAALLTLFVFSYLTKGLFGYDDLLFRLASCLLVGTAIGFGSAVILRAVFVDQLYHDLVRDISKLPDSWIILTLDLVPVVLGVSLLAKLTPTLRGTTFSNLGLAYLFGIGAALAIGGALSGALVPQLTATMLSLAPQGDTRDWVNKAFIVVGTLGAFLAFRFIQPGTRPWQRVYNIITNSWGTIGRGFIMIAFGALLAGLIAARVSALVERLYSFYQLFPH